MDYPLIGYLVGVFIFVIGGWTTTEILRQTGREHLLNTDRVDDYMPIFFLAVAWPFVLAGGLVAAIALALVHFCRWYASALLSSFSAGKSIARRFNEVSD
jgi:hypothetical protein